MPDQKNQTDPRTDAEDSDSLLDRGGRRRLADRRQFSSSDHFPERRNLRHRRSDNERRSLRNQKVRKKLERRQIFKEKSNVAKFLKKNIQRARLTESVPLIYVEVNFAISPLPPIILRISEVIFVRSMIFSREATLFFRRL